MTFWLKIIQLFTSSVSGMKRSYHSSSSFKAIFTLTCKVSANCMRQRTAIASFPSKGKPLETRSIADFTYARLNRKTLVCQNHNDKWGTCCQRKGKSISGKYYFLQTFWLKDKLANEKICCLTITPCWPSSMKIHSTLAMVLVKKTVDSVIDCKTLRTSLTAEILIQHSKRMKKNNQRSYLVRNIIRCSNWRKNAYKLQQYLARYWATFKVMHARF